MKTIPLTQGLAAMVDDADFDFVNQWNWYANRVHGNFYARRDVLVDGKRRSIYMHQVLSGAAPGQYPDHIDGCTLNNQRSNLRIGSQSQNMANRGPTKVNTSGLKGVHWDKRKNKWMVQLKVDGKQRYIGRFVDKADAAKAYDDAALTAFGAFAKTNRMLGLLS